MYSYNSKLLSPLKLHAVQETLIPQAVQYLDRGGLFTYAMDAPYLVSLHSRLSKQLLYE